VLAGSRGGLKWRVRMYLAYSALLAMGLLLSLPYWILQALWHGKYRAGLSERMGKVPARLLKSAADPVIWLHAVSVGELLAFSALAQQLKSVFPRFRVLISTTTDSAQQLARSRFGRENVFYFPLDFAFAIKPYLRKLRPKLIIVAETEFWPNFLRLAGKSGARIAIVNGRISDRSWPGYKRWRLLLARVLEPVDLFLAQTEEDARRLLDIGACADRVQVAGNLKFDVTPPAVLPIVSGLRAALREGGAGPVLVCGSTVEGEEELLLAAFEKVQSRFPQAVMILAPRHPERFDHVAAIIVDRGIPFCRRSEWKAGPLARGILLLDSIGELAAIYALADLAFVGGSLVPRGGHNIVEPALHGKAIVVGAHTENFRDVVNLFAHNQALRIAQTAELSGVFMELLSDENQRGLLGSRAAQVVRTYSGAIPRTIAALEALLESSKAGQPLQSSKSAREDSRAAPR